MKAKSLSLILAVFLLSTSLLYFGWQSLPHGTAYAQPIGDLPSLDTSGSDPGQPPDARWLALVRDHPSIGRQEALASAFSIDDLGNTFELYFRQFGFDLYLADVWI